MADPVDEPPTKKPRKFVDPFSNPEPAISWLANSQIANPHAGLVGGKSRRGVSFRMVVASFEQITYGTMGASFLVIRGVVIDDKAAVPYHVSKAEQLYDAQMKMAAPQLQQSPITRGPYVRLAGQPITVTCFKGLGFVLENGQSILVSGAVWCIRPPAQAKKADYVPEPSLSITVESAMLVEEASFNSLFTLAKKFGTLPAKQILLLCAEEKPAFPENSIVYKTVTESQAPSLSGVAPGMVVLPQSSSDPYGDATPPAAVSEPTLQRHGYDLSKIPDEVIFGRAYQEHYTWIVVANDLYSDPDALSFYEDCQCKIFVFPCPPMGKDKKFYLAKEKKKDKDAPPQATNNAQNADDDALLVSPCIRRTLAGSKEYFLDGRSIEPLADVNPDPVEINMPIYEANEIYQVCTKEIWPQVGGQLFLGTRAVVCLKLSLPTIYENFSRNPEATFKLFGYPTIYLSAMDTFMHAGYLISKEEMVEWMSTHYDSQVNKGTGSKIITPIKYAKNPHYNIFQEGLQYLGVTEENKAKLDALKVVCLNEIVFDPSIHFEESAWAFFAVPSWNLRDGEIYKKPINEWMREENIFGLNSRIPKENFSLIKDNWNNKLLAKNVVLFAVRKDA